jgi:hypothetical protein
MCALLVLPFNKFASCLTLLSGLVREMSGLVRESGDVNSGFSNYTVASIDYISIQYNNKITQTSGLYQ